MKLSVTTFDDQTDRIGFMQTDPDTHSFLSVERVDEMSFPLNTIGDSRPYFAAVGVHLSDKRHSLERTAYTFFQLLGDVGGFNGAIILFPSFIMSYLSECLFRQSLAKQIPTRKQSNHRSHNQYEQR